MRVLRQAWHLAIAVGTTLGCGGDGGGPSPAALAGTWLATKAEFVSVAVPTTKVDLVASGGTVELVLTQGGSFTLTSTVPGEPQEVITGAWSSSSDVLTLTIGSGNMQFNMSLSGDLLSLTGANTGFDFDSDGVDEDAKVNLTLSRQ